MKTENLAIVFVDIAGFTERTSTQSREENEAMLKRFDAVVRPAVRSFDGRVIKTIGDAYLLTFRSPTDALHCGMAIHDGLAEENAGRSETERFDVRIAVNVGDVRVEAGDVFGEAVNVASRIEGKTPAGEIYFSEAVYLSMTRAEVPSAEVGASTLKGIPEPVTLYRVPRSAEVGGYQLAGRDGGEVEAVPEHRLGPTDLPYGGHGLTHMRARGPVTLEAQRKVAALVGTATPLLVRTRRALAEQGAAFMARFCASARFRYVTLGVVGLLLLTLILAVTWPRPEPKPQTPWEKIKHGLGLD